MSRLQVMGQTLWELIQRTQNIYEWIARVFKYS